MNSTKFPKQIAGKLFINRHSVMRENNTNTHIKLAETRMNVTQIKHCPMDSAHPEHPQNKPQSTLGKTPPPTWQKCHNIV